MIIQDYFVPLHQMKKPQKSKAIKSSTSKIGSGLSVSARAYFSRNQLNQNINDMETKHIIDNIQLTKHSNGNDNLSYTADGVFKEVDGEFYVDRQHKLYHSHIFEDGTEIEITIPYENGTYNL